MKTLPGFLFVFLLAVIATQVGSDHPNAHARHYESGDSALTQLNVTGTATPITFTKTSGVSVAGNNETKTTPEGWGNSGASSVQIISGDGYVETTVAETNKARMFGLSNDDTNTNYNDIDFAVYLTNIEYLMVYERGANRGTFDRVKTGDVLRVAVQGGVVRYSNNGTVFYTSTIAPSFPLFIDTALRTPGATLQNVVIFNNATVKSDAEKRAEIDRSQPPTATRQATLVPRPATIDDMIDLGAPPLSNEDMEKMMAWIGAQTSALRLPFCWKLSEPRPNNDLGTPMVCKPGYNQDTAGLCYKNCAADERGIATFCYKNCPANLPDDGLYCRKQGEYGRGAGYVIWQESNCKNDNPQGCEQSGALWYPKCKPGYAPFGCCLCKPACPAGWEDIGVSCKKPNYAREVLPITECVPGRERSGLLCYPPCTKPGYEGIANGCFQKCGMGRNFDCGGACATDQKECAVAVLKQVASPILAIISMASFGIGNLVMAPAKAAQVTASVTRLAAMAAKVKQALVAAKGSVEALAGGAANLQKMANAVKIGGKLFVAGSAIGREVDMFSREFADNFDAWTSPEISKEIDQRFGKEAAFQIKRQWGLRHLTLMLETDGIASAKNVLNLVSIVDITGTTSIMEAFLHPTCVTDLGFPKVTPLYDR